MSKELVSIIIPTYNRAYCLPRAIDSALAQTHQDLELLIVDDGSQDNTRDLVAELYGHEPRVKYIHQKNGGVSEARNTAIRNLTGNFAGLLDSDDYWYPWKIEAQLALFRRYPQIVMSWTNMEGIDAQGRVFDPFFLKHMYETWKKYTDDDLFPHQTTLHEIAPQLKDTTTDAFVGAGDIFTPMWTGSLVHTSTVLLRKECLDKVGFFNPELKGAGEDFDFHLRTCREGEAGFINISSIQYQQGFTDHLGCPANDINLATNFLKAIMPVLTTDRARLKLTDRQICEVLAEGHQWLGEKALIAGQTALGRKHLWYSLCKNWKQPRSAILWMMACMPFNLEASLRRSYRYVKSRLRPVSRKVTA